MVRRLQLMEPEPRGPGTRIAEAVARLRDGLLRDNKVLPPVLAALALIIFAWLLAGVIIGDPGEEERVGRQTAQPSVAQAPEDGAASSETPAPGVENRDNESVDVYESKDPFRELFPTADADGDAAGGDTGGADGTGSGAGSGSDGTGSGTGPGGDDGTGSGDSNGTGSGSGDGSGAGSDQYGGSGGDDFLDQTSPGDPGFDDGSGNGGGSANGGNGGGSGEGNGSGGGQYGDGDGNGDLFDSGGDLRRRHPVR